MKKKQKISKLRIKGLLMVFVMLLTFFVFTVIPVQELQAEPVTIGVAVAVIVGAMVLSGVVFANYEEVQEWALDFYDNAPEAIRTQINTLAQGTITAGYLAVTYESNLIDYI